MDIQSRNLKLIALLGLIIILGTVYFITFYNQRNVDSSIHSDMTHDTATEPTSAKDTATISGDTGISIKKERWSPMGDAASKAEIIDWFAKRGVYGFGTLNEQSEYDSYSLETLAKLGDTGDIKALHKLALITPNKDQRKKILEQAAVYGSTGALAHLGIMTTTIGAVGDSKTPEEKKQLAKEALAYYEAAVLRGDWDAKMSFSESALRLVSGELAEQDQRDIQKRAQEIYDDLQAKRTTMGLGDFDNSVPDSVMKYYEEMLRPLH